METAVKFEYMITQTRRDESGARIGEHIGL